MYAEKIFELKFLPRRGTYMLKPVLRTFDADVFLRGGERITVVSAPPGREDYVLLDYHAVVDSVYDAVRTLKSVGYNDVGVEERYYVHPDFGPPGRIEVNVDMGRRLRKLEWAFDDFFEAYLLAVDELRRHVDKGLWKYGNAYLVSMGVDERVPDGVAVRMVSPLDGFTRFDVVFSSGRIRARVVGPPLNSFCFLSVLRNCDLDLLFRVYFKKPDRVWVERLYRKYVLRFIPVLREYLEDLDPVCDAASFGRKRSVRINVYAFDEEYDERLYFKRIMRKKCLYVGDGYCE